MVLNLAICFHRKQDERVLNSPIYAELKSFKEDQGSTEIILPAILFIKVQAGRHAETPECWSLEFQLDATFADNSGHFCKQIKYLYVTTIFLSFDQNHMKKFNLAGIL